MNSGFFYKTAAEREKLVVAERKFVDDKVRQVIKLKNQVSHWNGMDLICSYASCSLPPRCVMAATRTLSS